MKNPSVIERCWKPSSSTKTGTMMAKRMAIPCRNRKNIGISNCPRIRNRNHAIRSDWRKTTATMITSSFPNARMSGITDRLSLLLFSVIILTCVWAGTIPGLCVPGPS